MIIPNIFAAITLSLHLIHTLNILVQFNRARGIVMQAAVKTNTAFRMTSSTRRTPGGITLLAPAPALFSATQ